MRAEHLEIFVEEPSMEAALNLLIPKIVGKTSFNIFTYQGKSDLISKLPNRLRAYARFLPANWKIIVVVDRDRECCVGLKAKLDAAAASAGLQTKSNGTPYVFVSRVAIEELEAWFFGDWTATCAAYPKLSRNLCNNSKYRDPDAISGGTWEALERQLQRAGYFKSGLRKVELARAISEHMVPDCNRSASFRAFASALKNMIDY